MEEHLRMNRLLEVLISLLDIPPSYYEQAKERGRSLEAWLRRDVSLVAPFSPDVFPQGSFRYGTVIRPLLEGDYYDLDLVCAVSLAKCGVTQKQVKELIGREVQAYAQAKQFNDPAEEKPRCWRLNYADEVSFHMDILPSVPEDGATIQAIIEHGVPSLLAVHAIGITDKRHPRYDVLDPLWFSSNPRGIAGWFEDQSRAAASSTIAKLVESRTYASVEEVPPYEWKTTLQRSIQILKRHRDVMFQDDRELAPISMIITTLAAHAYCGEQDLRSALANILERMPAFINRERPRIPNPVNPAEDFADCWSRVARCEDCFWLWHAQAKADLMQLATVIDEARLSKEVNRRFKVNLSERDSRMVLGVPQASRIVRAAPTIISAAPRPWRRDA